MPRKPHRLRLWAQTSMSVQPRPPTAPRTKSSLSATRTSPSELTKFLAEHEAKDAEDGVHEAWIVQLRGQFLARRAHIVLVLADEEVVAEQEEGHFSRFVLAPVDHGGLVDAVRPDRGQERQDAIGGDLAGVGHLADRHVDRLADAVFHPFVEQSPELVA